MFLRLINPPSDFSERLSQVQNKRQRENVVTIDEFHGIFNRLLGHLKYALALYTGNVTDYHESQEN